MSRAIGIAGPSEIAVRAGAEVAEAGGNAVDAAVAATLAALCTEIGIVGLDAAAYVTLWRPGEAPVVIDGGIAMPGLDRPVERFGAAGREAVVDYGGGLRTLVGYGSVGVGGAVAALGQSAASWGSLAWPALVAPALARVRDGFPLSRASHTWLRYSHRKIFGWQAESAAVIHDARGALLPAGAAMRVPGRSRANGPMLAPGPTCACSRCEQARICAPSPTATPGPKNTFGSTSTSVPISVSWHRCTVSGAGMETPDSISPWRRRRCQIPSASASSARLLRPSALSALVREATAFSPFSFAISTRSVR